MEEYKVELIVPKNSVLIAKDNEIILRDNKGNESATPISILQDIHLIPAKAYTYGKIKLVLDDTAPSSFVHVGFGVMLGLNKEGSLEYSFIQGWAKEAEALYHYVVSVMKGSGGNESVSASAGSFVDELMKLKSLLDQGALSQEEFDQAKKKLLEL